MKRFWKIAAMLLALSILLPLPAVKGKAEDRSTVVVDQGVYQGITWKIESRWNDYYGSYDRILVVSGNGPIPDFDSPVDGCVGDVLPPWFRCKWTRYLDDEDMSPAPNQAEWWYKTGTGWGTHFRGIEIGSGITAIGNYAFCPATEYANYIDRVVIPDTVKRIGACAFASQFDLREVQIPDSVTQIDFPGNQKQGWALQRVFDGRTCITCSSKSAAYRYAVEAGNPVLLTDLQVSFTVNGTTLRSSDYDLDVSYSTPSFSPAPSRDLPSMQQGQTIRCSASASLAGAPVSAQIAVSDTSLLSLNASAGTLTAAGSGNTTTVSATARAGR